MKTVIHPYKEISLNAAHTLLSLEASTTLNGLTNDDPPLDALHVMHQ